MVGVNNSIDTTENVELCAISQFAAITDSFGRVSFIHLNTSALLPCPGTGGRMRAAA